MLAVIEPTAQAQRAEMNAKGASILRHGRWKRGLRWITLASACAVWGVQAQLAPGGEGEQPADFAVQVPLGLTGTGPWFRLALPLALQLSARHADLQDLRIFNGAGEPLSLALFHEPALAANELQENAVRWFPLYDTAGAPAGSVPAFKAQLGQSGSLVSIEPGSHHEPGDEALRGWLVDTSAINGLLVSLNLDWNSDREGFQRFSIEASDDLQHWRPCGEGQVARIVFVDEHLERHTVGLPGQHARYLRLLWLSPRTAPLLSNVHVISRQPSELPPTLQWSGPIVGTRQRRGEYVWQLPVPLAVERMKVEVAQNDTLAPVTVHGRSAAAEPWRALSDGLVYRQVQDGQELVADELPLEGEHLQALMVRVDERGSGLGDGIPALRVAVQPTQVIFLASGSAPFSLAVGNPHARVASVPLPTLLASIHKPLSELGVARLAGTPMIAMGARAEVPEEVDWKRVAVIAVAAMGLVVLVIVGRTLLRRRDE